MIGIKKIKIFKHEEGASAVEFAFILPILVILVFGIFEFGIAYNNFIALTHAAREGARLAAVGKYQELGVTEFEARVRESSPSVTIESITVSGLDGDIGDPVSVTVTGEVLRINIPLVGSWPVQLTSTAVMRLEK